MYRYSKDPARIKGEREIDMFKKMMAKLGVGAATVDLVLNRQHYELGETVEGVFRVTGGSVEQQINAIAVRLNVAVHLEESNVSDSVARIPVAKSFVIRPGEQKEFPFRYTLPVDMPISRWGVAYQWETELDIAGGRDGSDHDPVQVCPPVRFANLIRAFDLLGLKEKHKSGKFNGYVQEFEFEPTSLFKKEIEEVEFQASLEADGIRMMLEVDMYSLHGFGERELTRVIHIGNEVLADVHDTADFMEQAIQEMLQHPEAYDAAQFHDDAEGHHGHDAPRGLTGAMGASVAAAIGGIVLAAIAEEEADELADDDEYVEEEEYVED
jgi:sporulation-control protein